MVCLLQVDRIVEGELIRYGVQLSSIYLTYSNIIRFAFVLSWFNIIAAIGVHLYSITFRRKELEQLVTAADAEVRRRQLEQLRQREEPPILPGLPEQESFPKTETEREPEHEVLVVPAQN
jgi:hypothetical protein